MLKQLHSKSAVYDGSLYVMCRFFDTKPQSNAAEEQEDYSMALTRKMLKAMGIEDEKVDQIIEAHTETTDALKSERDRYKATAEQLPAVQAELKKAQEDLAAAGTSEYEEKYKTAQAELDKLKAETEAAKTHGAKEAAYRALLKAAGIPDAWIARAMRGVDIDALKIDKDGKLTDEATLSESVKKDWADVIPETHTEGVPTPNPPTGSTPQGGAEPGSLREALAQKYNTQKG